MGGEFSDEGPWLRDEARLSYGVKGADPVALRILARRWERRLSTYCTSGYKDGWAAAVAHQATCGQRRSALEIVTEDERS